jgi:hypothetical protein
VTRSSTSTPGCSVANCSSWRRITVPSAPSALPEKVNTARASPPHALTATATAAAAIAHDLLLKEPVYCRE